MLGIVEYILASSLTEVAASGIRIPAMKPIPRRVQLGVVAAAYGAALLVAAVLVYARHMQYVNHPADAMASGACMPLATGY
jgi:hypothetical protein